jgi:hypothetical protein
VLEHMPGSFTLSAILRPWRHCAVDYVNGSLIGRDISNCSGCRAAVVAEPRRSLVSM